MSDLVGNPKDQFSRVAAHGDRTICQSYSFNNLIFWGGLAQWIASQTWAEGSLVQVQSLSCWL